MPHQNRTVAITPRGRDESRRRRGAARPVNGHQELTHLGHEELTHPGVPGRVALRQ
jgi:hypothetical protein